MYFAEHRPIIIPKWQFLFIRAFLARQVRYRREMIVACGAQEHHFCNISTTYTHCTGVTQEMVCLFPASTEKRPISPPRNGILISHVIFTFLMISFDYDKPLKAMICFCCFPCYILNTADLRIYTSDKHFVRSQFILIAPLCQRLLMIFYRTRSLDVSPPSLRFRWRAWCSDLDADQTTFYLWELMITQPFWCRAHSWKGAKACFAYLGKCFNCLHMLQKQTNWRQTRDLKVFCSWKYQHLTCTTFRRSVWVFHSKECGAIAQRGFGDLNPAEVNLNTVRCLNIIAGMTFDLFEIIAAPNDPQMS